jgi:hypothetical protein
MSLATPGTARLAAVDIGYRDSVIPFRAFHDFMHFYLPSDISSCVDQEDVCEKYFARQLKFCSVT